jgi:hypothetical protein
VRRIGKTIAEQVELYGTLTGEHQVVPPRRREEKETGDVLPFRRTGEQGA